MTNYLKMIWLCAIALIVVVVFWLGRRATESKHSLVTQASNTNILSTPNTETTRTEKRQNNITTSPPAFSEAPNPSQPALTNSEQQLRTLVENRNVPINFWGAVLDQQGSPLEGVKIIGNIRRWYVTKTLNFDSQFPEVSAVTDAGGKFEIHDGHGDILTIKAMVKEGYEPEPGALRGFGYNTPERFAADPNNPIVFRMWKTNLHEQLIVGDKRFHVIPDGRPYLIDFAKGTISETGDGDLRLWIKRPDSIVFGQRYDWSCELEVINGGLLQEIDSRSAMFSAPEDGYKPSFKFEQKLASGWSDTTGELRFYLMLHNSHEYGRILIELYAYYNDRVPSLVDLKYTINPSGSRVLR